MKQEKKDKIKGYIQELDMQGKKRNDKLAWTIKDKARV